MCRMARTAAYGNERAKCKGANAGGADGRERLAGADVSPMADSAALLGSGKNGCLTLAVGSMSMLPQVFLLYERCVRVLK